MKNIFLIMLGMTLLSGCASALKKQCEATNWFDYGYKFAMTGKRLNSDSFVEQCKKEDVVVRESELDVGFKAGMQNYCKPEIVYATGKNGEVLNTDFCDPSQVKILQRKHAEGIEQYCQKSNGYPVGSSGKLYTQVCSKDLEVNFLKEYRRGRKVYLDQAIVSKEQENVELERQAQDLQMTISRKESEKRMIPSAAYPHFYAGMSEQQRNNEQARVNSENDRISRQRQDIDWSISDTSRRITGIRTKQTDIRNEIFEMKKEKASIENQ